MFQAGVRGGCLDIFPPPIISFLSPSLCKTAQYRLKYCPKELLNLHQAIKSNNMVKILCTGARPCSCPTLYMLQRLTGNHKQKSSFYCKFYFTYYIMCFAKVKKKKNNFLSHYVILIIQNYINQNANYTHFVAVDTLR